MFKSTKKLLPMALIVATVFLFAGCGRRREAEIERANTQIENALGNIRVNAGGSNDILRNFRIGDGRTFSNIDVDIDFAHILYGLPTNVFLIAREHANRHIDSLYNDLALMFRRTDHLTIRAQNADRLTDFDLPPDMNDLREIPIEVSRFLEYPDKFLRLITYFGNLDLYSEFFYGRTGLGIARADEDLILLFGFDENEDVGNTEIRIAILNRLNDDEMLEIDVQHPGRSSLLTIPLSSGFMRGENNELLYNAVEYIDIDGNANGVLPRSFIDGDNLYVYFNRTGRFRLTRTVHGNTTNRANFLRDRGIVLTGIQHDGQTIVTRGEFYDAIMMIHWVENLYHDFSGVRPFPDLPRIPDRSVRFSDFTNDQRLAQHILIGQALDAFPLRGFPDGFFRPHNPLRRSQLFIILAGYIEAFGMNVHGLMPAQAGAIGRPSGETRYWHDAFFHLESLGFVPYRINGNVVDVAAEEYVTLQEAQEILFRLITTRHFE